MLDTSILYGDDVLHGADAVPPEWSERNSILIMHAQALKSSIGAWQDNPDAPGGESIRTAAVVALAVVDLHDVRHILVMSTGDAIRVMQDIGAALKGIRDDAVELSRINGRCEGCGAELDADGNHP